MQETLGLIQAPQGETKKKPQGQPVFNQYSKSISFPATQISGPTPRPEQITVFALLSQEHVHLRLICVGKMSLCGLHMGSPFRLLPQAGSVLYRPCYYPEKAQVRASLCFIYLYEFPLLLHF